MDHSPVVEAPSNHPKGGIYHVFFSLCGYPSTGYDVDYFQTESMKNFYKNAGGPLLKTRLLSTCSSGGAPGQLSPTETKIVFHTNCRKMQCKYANAIGISCQREHKVYVSLS